MTLKPKNLTKNIELSRRTFVRALAGGLALSLFPLSSCRRRFVRPGGELRLGQLEKLLFAEQHIADKSILLRRDTAGWSALSTRCTYEGCDLTNQEENLLCHCCHSLFAANGRVLKGPASDNLPWYEVYYKDNLLFVNTAKQVTSKARFTTPEIEAAIKKLRAKIKKDGPQEGVKIPKILLGDIEEEKGELEAFSSELEHMTDQDVMKATDKVLRPY